MCFVSTRNLDRFSAHFDFIRRKMDFLLNSGIHFGCSFLYYGKIYLQKCNEGHSYSMVDERCLWEPFHPIPLPAGVLLRGENAKIQNMLENIQNFKSSHSASYFTNLGAIEENWVSQYEYAVI